MGLREIEAEIGFCKRCHLHKSASVKVVGDYDHTVCPKVIFIGEGPGEEEDKAGRPFVGKSGQILRNELKAFPKTLYCILNSVKCHPAGNAPPTNKQINICRRHLKAQLLYFKPQIIVVLGRTAYKAVMQREMVSMYKQANTTLTGEHLFKGKLIVSVKVFPHPAALLYDRPKWQPIWDSAFASLRYELGLGRPKTSMCSGQRTIFG